MCRAEKLYYVTTAGGFYDPTYSYGYIEKLAKSFFGIPQTYLVKAEGLDIAGNDAETIINREIHLRSWLQKEKAAMKAKMSMEEFVKLGGFSPAK